MDQKVHMPRSHRALCLKDQNVHVHKVLKSQSSIIEGDKQQYRPKWYCVYKIAKKLRLHLDGKSPIFFDCWADPAKHCSALTKMEIHA